MRKQGTRKKGVGGMCGTPQHREGGQGAAEMAKGSGACRGVRAQVKRQGNEATAGKWSCVQEGAYHLVGS